MSKAKPLVSLLLVSALALEPGVSLAQVPPAPAQPPAPPALTFAVGTSAVALDVVVRDRKGRLVKGLTRADFEVLEDGARQQVEAFSVVARGVEGDLEEPPAASTPDPPGGARVPAPAPAPPPVAGDDQPALVAFVFDRMSVEGRDVALKAALTYFSARRDGDFAGIFSIDLSLHMIQNFTSDPDRIRLALAEAATQSSTAFTDSRQQSRDLQRLEGSLLDSQAQLGAATPGPGTNSDALSAGAAMAAGTAVQRDMAQMTVSMLRSFERLERDQQGYATSNALLAVVKGLSRVPGRKTVVFFSEGMAIPERVQSQFLSVIHEANRGNVAIYTMDAGGLRTQSPTEETRREMMAYNEQRFRALGREGAGGIMMKDAERNEDLLRLNPQAGLGQLADQTGGFLIRDTNDARPSFRQIAQDMRFHYVLGYTPANQEYDGRFRSVSVKVRRPGMEIHSRRGYFAVRPGQSSPLLPYEITAVTLLDRAGPKPDAFPLASLALNFPQGGSTVKVPVLLEIPGTAVKYQPDPRVKDTFTGDLAVVVRIRNQYNQEVSRLSQHFELSAPAAKLQAARSGNILFYREAELPPGRYTFEAVACDPATTQASVSTFAVDVPSPAAGGASLSSLVLVDRAERVPDFERDPANPLYFGEALLYPSLSRSYRKSLSKAVAFYFTARGVSSSRKALLEIVRDGQLIKGLPLDLPAPDADGQVQHAGALPLDAFGPGSYDLRLSLLDGAQRLVSSTTSFSVAE
jgi:VWFA-related protein